MSILSPKTWNTSAKCILCMILMNYDKVEFVENYSFLKKYMYLKSSSFYDKNQENWIQKKDT